MWLLVNGGHSGVVRVRKREDAQRRLVQLGERDRAESASELRVCGVRADGCPAEGEPASLPREREGDGRVPPPSPNRAPDARRVLRGFARDPRAWSQEATFRVDPHVLRRAI